MRILLALLLVSLATAAQAQVALTVQAGLQAADLSDQDPLVGMVDPSIDAVILAQRPRYGLRAGVGLRVPVTRDIAVHPEVAYAQKGRRLSYGPEFVGGARVTADRFYNDLEALVMVSSDVLRDDDITAALEAGPAVVVRLGETACRTPGQSSPCVPDDDPGRASLGLAVGAVVSMGAGGVGVRYMWGGRDTAPQGTEAKPIAETLAVTFRLRFR